MLRLSRRCRADAMSSREAVSTAKRHAKALAIDHTLAESTLAAHEPAILEWRRPRRIQQRAIELNPITPSLISGTLIITFHDGRCSRRGRLGLNCPLRSRQGDWGQNVTLHRQYARIERIASPRLEPNSIAHTSAGWVDKKKKMYREAIAEFRKQRAI